MIKEKPFVSILVPIRNVAPYAKECLDALVNLNYPKNRLEILILDNHSTDGSIEIINEYEKKHDHIKLIQMGVHWPPLKYNMILPQTKGSIIGFVDGDANVSPNWLIKVVDAIKDRDVAGATSIIQTHNHWNILARCIGYEFSDRYKRAPDYVTRATTMNTVYKKSVLEEIGGFNEQLKTGYDCEIGHRIKFNGKKIRLVKDPDAYVYHNHRSSIKKYFIQQFEYAEWAIIRNIMNPAIGKGDETTPYLLTIQPLIYAIGLSSIIIGLLLNDFSFALIIFGGLTIAYIYGALRLSMMNKDTSALFIFLMYWIRGIGWFLGGWYTIIRYVLFKEKIFERKRVNA